MTFPGKIAHTHNNKTKKFNLYETQKRPKPKIVRTADYNCAYVMVMAVLIIFSVILQTVFNVVMLSMEGRRRNLQCLSGKLQLHALSSVL